MKHLDWALPGTVVVLLTIATIVGQVLKRQTQLGLNSAAVASFNSRLQSWWMICCVLIVAFINREVTIFLFCCLGFTALREFLTLTPTRPADHRALFWVLAFFTPLQFVFVALRAESLFNIFIPVFAFLFIPARVALSGDYKRFLERVAKIQSGLLICVYCLSFAPALMDLKLPGTGGNARYLYFFVTLALLSEAMQFIWGKLYGKHVIAPSINESRTWEGLVGGVASTALVGMLLSWATPYEFLWQTAFMSMLIAVMGSAGALTMSAIKRDRGVKDYGTLVEGHAGLLDRIDGICFAAPVFYHVSRYLFEM